MLPLKLIICPTDFSAPACTCVRVAGELAEHFNAELLLVNIVPALPGVPPAPNYALAERDSRVRVLMFVLLAFILVQAIWITKVYGTLPILSYLRQDGKIDIITANQLQEAARTVPELGLTQPQVVALRQAFENTLVTNMGCDVVDQPPS